MIVSSLTDTKEECSWILIRNTSYIRPQLKNNKILALSKSCIFLDNFPNLVILLFQRSFSGRPAPRRVVSGWAEEKTKEEGRGCRDDGTRHEQGFQGNSQICFVNEEFKIRHPWAIWKAQSLNSCEIGRGVEGKIFQYYLACLRFTFCPVFVFLLESFQIFFLK